MTHYEFPKIEHLAVQYLRSHPLARDAKVAQFLKSCGVAAGLRQVSLHRPHWERIAAAEFDECCCYGPEIDDDEAREVVEDIAAEIEDGKFSFVRLIDLSRLGP